jgi:hypothetical protein
MKGKLALYAVAALTTGLLHGFLFLAGLVHNALGLLILSGLLGSAMLVLAAMIVWFQPRLAAKIGLGGSILLWFEYGSLVHTYFWIDRVEIQISGYTPFIERLIGPAPLVACTVSSALLLRGDPVSARTPSTT